MPLSPYRQHRPRLGQGVYCHPSATVIGRVELGDDVSLWCNTVLRGDMNFIRVGAGSNLQDGVLCHVSGPHRDAPAGAPLIVGARVSVGHGAILHGCTIGDDCLIGIGAIILDRAAVGFGAVVGAGSLVPEGKILEGGWLYLGTPVRAIRPVSTDEAAANRARIERYIALKNDYLRSGSCSSP